MGCISAPASGNTEQELEGERERERRKGCVLLWLHKMENAKGRLQEKMQRRGLPVPSYEVNSSGPSNCPLVHCTVTVRLEGGRSLSESVECRGEKKREVEKLAAKNMLARLDEESGLHNSHRQAPSRPAAAATSSPGLSRAPFSSPGSGSRSPVAVLQEKIQAMRLSRPVYREEQLGEQRFRVCCSLLEPALQAQGEARSKQDAKDAAARDMLRKMAERSRVGAGLHSLSVAPDPPGLGDQPEPMAADLPDDLAAAKLASLSPQYHYWKIEGEVSEYNHPLLPSLSLSLSLSFSLSLRLCAVWLVHREWRVWPTTYQAMVGVRQRQMPKLRLNALS